MPEISRFFGIVIYLHFDDHLPPHFHAVYNEFEVSISIYNFGIVAGGFPPRALSLVTEWALIHHDELIADWNKAVNHEKLLKIEPLK